MAPLPVIPGCFRVTMKWTGSGTVMGANVMHFTKPSGSVSALVTALASNLTTNMFWATSANTSLTTLSVLPLDGTSATTVHTLVTFVQGGTAGDYIPASCMIVSLKTGLRGPANRGRVYTPFVAEAAQTSGILVGTAVSGAQTAWNTFITNMGTAGFPLGVASYSTGQVHNVTSCVVQSVCATQRRRQSRLR